MTEVERVVDLIDHGLLEHEHQHTSALVCMSGRAHSPIERLEELGIDPHRVDAAFAPMREWIDRGHSD